MNQLPLSKRAQIISMLVEGSSMRAVSRVVGCSINTVSSLMLETAHGCLAYHNRYVRNLWLDRVQLDEIWSFYGARAMRKKNGGDIWTFVALCPDSKLIPAWHIGNRTDADTLTFLNNLRSRLVGHLNVSSDGFYGYTNALEKVENVNYGKIIKHYANTEFIMGRSSYCKSVSKKAVIGNPDMEKVTTSHVERHNLTIRTSCARYGRKTNAHSKKFENHVLAFSLYAFFYNFCRVHSAIKTTPAVKAGLTDRVWAVQDLLYL